MGAARAQVTAKVPHGRWKTMIFLAALRHDVSMRRGLSRGRSTARAFGLYVEKVLLPTLRPGDIVVLDNLGSHRSKAVRQLIRSAGAKLFFLPKYSPDLNPIEQVFAKLKPLHQKGRRANRRRRVRRHRRCPPAFTQKNAQTISKIQAIAPNVIML